MKFEHWLRNQIKRNDATGDIARDFVDSLSIKKFHTLESSMNHFNPCEDAVNAAESARDEYFELMGAVTCQPSNSTAHR